MTTCCAPLRARFALSGVSSISAPAVHDARRRLRAPYARGAGATRARFVIVRG